MFRSSKFLTVLLTPLLLLLSLIGCSATRATLGQAYVAPASLHLRSDLSAKSTVVAELKHGDHLQIVDVQRRMVRVRTDKNVEGFVDPSQLLSPDQMEALKQRRQQESTLPPEGTATAYETLNVHIDPERPSPAFAQITAGESITVLGHKIVPKLTNSSRTSTIIVSRPTALSRKGRKEQKSAGGSFRTPPKPPPPKPPENWLALSAERIDGGADQQPTKPVAPLPKPAKASSRPAVKPVMDDWTLVRTRTKQIGWVLTRNILMSIPDDVAQYAEGKNITAFFDLGAVSDDVKGPKHNWLWATAARGGDDDFDAWRVFLWNNHRHRYETSYRQRDLEGYFPIRVAPAEDGSPLRNFGIVTKDEDGKMRLRSYTFDGHLVHLANTEDYNPAEESAKQAAALDTNDLAARVKQLNWFQRQVNNIKHLISGN